MPITIHESGVQIGTGGAPAAAQYRKVAEFSSPGAEAMGRGLQQLGQSMGQVAGKMHQQAVEENQADFANAITDQKTQSAARVNQWQIDFEEQHKEMDAQGYAEAYSSFMQEERASWEALAGGDKKRLASTLSMFNSVYGSGLIRAQNYSAKEKESYGTRVDAEDWANSRATFINPDIPLAEKETALRTSEMGMRARAGQTLVTGEDGKQEWTGGKNIESTLIARKEEYRLDVQESLKQDDTRMVLENPQQAAQVLEKWRKDGGVPKNMQPYFKPAEWAAHAAYLERLNRDQLNAQGMNAKNLLGNYQSYKEHAIETGDFGPMQQTAAALAAAGPDYADNLAAVERDIETYSAVRPMATLNTSRPLIEQEREGLDYLQGQKNPENTAYMNDVMHDVARGYDAQRKAIKADPAAFVSAEIDKLKAFSGEERTAISLQLQADLYAGTDIVPQVLTRERRDYIQQQWSSDSYQDKMNLVAEVQREYGAFAAQALDEAKIPDAVVATAPIFSALDQGVQARWMAAASTKQGDIPADSETRKVVKEEVENSAMMQALRSAGKATHNSEAQFELMNGVQNTLENYVLLGGKLGDIEKSFAIINDSGSALVMPASEYTRDFEVLLDAARDEWRGTVPDYIDKLKEPARSQELSLWRSQIANGNFVYSLADRGAVLCDEATGKIIYGTKPVQPREVTYEERMKRGLANSGKALMGWGSI